MLSKVFDLEKLGKIYDSEIEKKVNEKYRLFDIIEAEESIWDNIVGWVKEAEEWFKLGKDYYKEIDNLEKIITEARMALAHFNTSYLSKINDKNIKLQCSRLTRRRTGQDSIMLERPDGSVCWMTVPKEEKKLQLPTVDLYGDKAARQKEIDRIDRELAEKKGTEAPKLSLEEKVEKWVLEDDKANRWSSDTKEISYLWDYWRSIKIMQYLARGDDTSSSYKADLELIKQGYKENDCLDDEELITHGAELDRIQAEVTRIRKEAGLLINRTRLEDMEHEIYICECGEKAEFGYEGEIAGRVGRVGLIRCCQGCARVEAKNKHKFDMICAGCGKHVVIAGYAKLNREGKLVCGDCV